MTRSKELSNLRRSYSLEELSRKSVSKNPIQQFSRWLDEAIDAKILDVTAMSLATADKNSIPSVRTVLLKGFDEEGFVFYSNYESDKGKDLAENPNAALLFYWKELERQIRISGRVEKLSREESNQYFRERPFESRVSTWVSKQSTIIISREYLDEKFEEYKKLFEGKDIPLPEYWGGYKVIPSKFEFWQGRENRLHDRILYVKKKDLWEIVRLSP